jgi:transcriptional regulator with XRE-family HTH domain
VTATHCKWGHPWDEANTYVYPADGRRLCRSCRRWAQANYRQARRPPRFPPGPLLALQGTQTDREFAQRIQVARRTVLRWRHGHGSGSIYWSTADRVATALGRSITDIWSEAA